MRKHALVLIAYGPPEHMDVLECANSCSQFQLARQDTLTCHNAMPTHALVLVTPGTTENIVVLARTTNAASYNRQDTLPGVMMECVSIPWCW